MAPLRKPMPTGSDADEEFEFLVNLLASDGIDPDPPIGASGSRKVTAGDDRGLKIRSGQDGKLDLGQVKAFYENKSVGLGIWGGAVGMTDGPGLADQGSRNKSGSSIGLPG